MEMLNSLLDAIKMKRCLFKLVYFVLPSPVPITPLILGSNKYDEGKKSVTHAPARESMETPAYQEG